MKRAELMLFSAIVAALLSLAAVAAWYLINQPVPIVAPAPEVSDWRPPIRKCPEDVKLWECIRHAMYREDI